MFPRAMNHKEKTVLADIKELGFAYELKFIQSARTAGYVANIPLLKETWSLDSPLTSKRIEVLQNKLKFNK